MTSLPGMAGESIPRWRLEQLNLMDFGHGLQVAGVIYADKEVVHVCMMPDEPLEGRQVRALELSQEDWQKIIRQTDLLETEILAQATDGKIAKVIVRKSTRVIDQSVSWSVYRRDQYQCRYCGRNDVPLTVDHMVLWEEGGPSIPENLITACKSCNRARGNMQYLEWLEDPYYKKVSAKLRPDFIAENRLVATTIDSIPRRVQQRGR